MSYGDEKVDDSLGRGTWKVKTSDISLLINSNDSNKQLASPLIFNAKSKIATRITLTARPENNGKVSLHFKSHSSRNGNFNLEIMCKPYFDKSNNESNSVDIYKVDKSSLLSPNTISIVYAITFSKKRCFAYSDTKNINHYSIPPTLSPNYKPISFQCSFDAAILSELRENESQTRDSSGYYRKILAAYPLQSIHESATNTTWLLCLTSDYHIAIQPVTSRADTIHSWIEIECPALLFYQCHSLKFDRKDYGLSSNKVFHLNQSGISHEKVINLKGHIFPTKWERDAGHRDITSEIYDASSLNTEKDYDLMMTKMNEMMVQIQTLNVGLNSLLKFSKELKNDNQKLKEVIGGMKVTLDNKLDKMDKNNTSNFKKVNNKIGGVDKTVIKMNKMVTSKLDGIQNALQNPTIGGDNSDILNKLDRMDATNASNTKTIKSKLGAMEKALNTMGKEMSSNLIEMGKELKEVGQKLDGIENALNNVSNGNQGTGTGGGFNNSNELKGMFRELKVGTDKKLDKMEKTNSANIKTMKKKLGDVEKTLNSKLSKIGNIMNSEFAEIKKVLNTLSVGDDNKANDDPNDAVFDPVYATFYHWLNNTVCLPQYLTNFKKSGYDSMEAVVELNEKDLTKEIVIKAKGHRVRLLKAIKKYTQNKMDKEGTSYM
eukprot:900739_1